MVWSCYTYCGLRGNWFVCVCENVRCVYSLYERIGICVVCIMCCLYLFNFCFHFVDCTYVIIINWGSQDMCCFIITFYLCWFHTIRLQIVGRWHLKIVIRRLCASQMDQCDSHTITHMLYTLYTLIRYTLIRLRIEFLLLRCERQVLWFIRFSYTQTHHFIAFTAVLFK